MGPLTLGLQLLLLLPPPRVVVIFGQLFCHSLGVDAESQGPDSEDVLPDPNRQLHTPKEKMRGLTCSSRDRVTPLRSGGWGL